jgi:hypothetical protein
MEHIYHLILVVHLHYRDDTNRAKNFCRSSKIYCIKPDACHCGKACDLHHDLIPYNSK